MSGVAGIYHLDGRPVDAKRLSRMADGLIHRGPDGAGQWVSGPVGLSHRQLHTTPESLDETQPWQDETGQLVLTFDGRVDNRSELRATLTREAPRLRTDSDVELVLRAYEHWGEQCPTRILGDFAFALWDGRRQQLFCARDPLGVKPFYYHTDGRTFVFASEMQPLFDGATIDRRPNLPLLARYLSNAFDEPEETLYEGVYRLPAAHALVQSRGTVRKVRYWSPDPGHQVRYRTDEEYAEHFLSLFREAVQYRLRSHQPVGAWLSGGLDSSSIACTAQMLYRDGAVPGNGLETFSVVFDELPCDEREYIDAVVRQWDLKAHLVTHEQHSRWVGIDQMPLYPDVLYQTTLLMGAPALRDMRQRKMRVVLDGIGGDELLAPGFAHLTDLVGQGSLFRLMTQLRHDSRIYDVPLRSLVWAHCCRPFIPSAVRKSLKPLATWFRRNRTASPLRPEFVAATALQGRARSTSRIQTFPTHAQQEIADGLASGWNVIGMDLNELFSARFSVESRRPFFDRRVVEFLLAIPGDQRWRGDEPKRILRRAMDGILPGAVQWRRSKTEFSPCIDRELRVRQADAVEEVFRHSTLASLGLADADRFFELFLTYRAEACYYPSWNMELLLALELWCRSIVRSPTN